MELPALFRPRWLHVYSMYMIYSVEKAKIGITAKTQRKYDFFNFVTLSLILVKLYAQMTQKYSGRLTDTTLAKEKCMNAYMNVVLTLNCKLQWEYALI